MMEQTQPYAGWSLGASAKPSAPNWGLHEGRQTASTRQVLSPDGIGNPVRNALCLGRGVESRTKRNRRVYKTRRAHLEEVARSVNIRRSNTG